ncbi:hypothetical protein Y1Q_0004955 [Alligator mississippiensis]|uniref:Uncharacterized protein n=1 Tax=Alligator mississippiensis TaxID=8496 RepID=A0A151MYE8_ALLMI|nr:hypothetical protein Y1Q_0004955 [Alligator mississippiensis]
MQYSILPSGKENEHSTFLHVSWFSCCVRLRRSGASSRGTARSLASLVPLVSHLVPSGSSISGEQLVPESKSCLASFSRTSPWMMTRGLVDWCLSQR